MKSPRKAWCIHYIGKIKGTHTAYRKAIAIQYKDGAMLHYGIVFFAKHGKRDGYYITKSLNVNPMYVDSKELFLTPL
jgi:hypothetical protein